MKLITITSDHDDIILEAGRRSTGTLAKYFLDNLTLTLFIFLLDLNTNETAYLNCTIIDIYLEWISRSICIK